MDVGSAYQQLKISLVATTGLTRDALHIYAGMAVLVLAVGLLRKPLQSVIPWLIVVFVAALAELPDIQEDFAQHGHWRWASSAHDFVNTVFWPTVLLFLTRWRFGPA
jgi:hypothetical protein